jgi:hypothetical protein
MTSDEYMKLVKDSMHPNSMRFGADYGLTCGTFGLMYIDYIWGILYRFY